MTRKTFFKERTPTEIRNLQHRRVYNQKGLIERIDQLGTEEGIILNCQITPGEFFRNSRNSAQASRKCYKHGKTLRLQHPQTKRECDNSPLTPLQLREEAFSKLKEMKEEINYIGYSIKPAWGDRTERRFPFVWMVEALRLFAYSENTQDDIKARIYKDAKRAKTEGTTVLAEVPSRRKGTDKYMFRLLNIPAIRSQHNLASVLTLKPAQLQEQGKPISKRIPHDSANIRYPYETSPERSEVITFYPHDIAAYIAVIRDETKQHNITPIEMNPFALFSQRGVKIYKRLSNNVLIFDPTISTKEGLRKLRIDEKSILLARAIGKFGHHEIAYWEPTRDGKLKNYAWDYNKT
jgi:hypothetical protein